MEITTAALLTRASPEQFSHLLDLYPTALQLKAESKSKKPQELIKLDEWYQNELPGKIRARGPDHYLTHDELVNCMRWKLARGKFRPRLKELVTMNSPRVVQQESRKAFRALFKKDDLTAAVNYLCNLKGIGPATASALLTAAAPDRAAFMADECLQAVPEIEGIDYTVAEYKEMMRAIGQAQAKLGSPDWWTPHRIELVLWTHNVLLSSRPELLAGVPAAGGDQQIQEEQTTEEEEEPERQHEEPHPPPSPDHDDGYQANNSNGQPAADQHSNGYREHGPPLIDESSTTSSTSLFAGDEEDSLLENRPQDQPEEGSLDCFANSEAADYGPAAPKKIKIL